MNEFVRAVEDSQRARREVARIQGEKEDPDRFARSRALAGEMGLPADFVNRNFEPLEKQAKRNRFVETVESNPATAKFFEDPDNYALASDDVESVGLLEGLWNDLQLGGLRVVSGYHQFRGETAAQIASDKDRSVFGLAGDAAKDLALSSGPLDAAMGPLDEAASFSARLLGKGFSALTGFDESARQVAKARFGKVGRLQSKMQALPMSDVARTQMDAVNTAWDESGFLSAVGAVVDDLIGSLALGVELGVQSIPQMAVGMAATLATRNPALGAAFMGGTSALTERYTSATGFLQGLGYDLAKPADLDRLLSSPDDLNKARDYGLTRGTIIGAFDWASGGVAGKSLSRSPLGNMVLQSFSQAGFGAGGESVGELASTGEFNGAEVIFEALGEMAFAPAEVVGVGGQYILDQTKATKARRSHRALQQVAEAVRATNLSRRDTGKTAELLGRIAGEDTKVYMPASSLDVLFQTDQEAGDAFLQNMGVQDQWDSAKAAGADLVIPAPNFLANANDARFEEYLTHVRVDPAEMTLAEAETFEAGREEAIKEVLAELEPSGEPDIRTEIAREVQRDLQVAGEAVEVSNYQSQLVAANVVTMAERLGQDPQQYFQENRAQIIGAAPDLKVPVDTYDTVIERARSGTRLEMDQTPVLSFLQGYGGVKRGSTLDAELRNLGVTEETVPGLFADTPRKEKTPQGEFELPLVGEADQIAPGASELFEGLPVGENGYLDMGILVGAVQKELAGEPIRTQDEQAQLANLDDPANALIEFLDTQTDLDIKTATNEEIKAAIEKASAETQGALEQTDPKSKAFRNWFKDSKVVDEKGEPLVVYHGTDAEIGAFDPHAVGSAQDGKLFLGRGFYFSTDKGSASAYGKNVIPVYLSAQSVLDVLDRAQFMKAFSGLVPRGQEKTLGQIAADYKKAKQDTVIEDTKLTKVDKGFFELQWKVNGEWKHKKPDMRVSPLEISDDKTGKKLALQYELPANPDDVRVSDFSSEQVTDAAKAAGFDGIRGDASIGTTGDEIVVFSPTQIKSVNNRGTFDPNDPRILFQPAYHGSPHLFDKFDLSKIGTGEGAQAFGWGLYFTGKKEIAKYYRDALSRNKRGYWSYSDDRVKNKRMNEGVVLDLMRNHPSDPIKSFLSGRDAQKAFRSKDEHALEGRIIEAIVAAANQRDQYKERSRKHKESPPVASTYTDKDYDEFAAAHDRQWKALKDFRASLKWNPPEKGGRLFEVNIPDDGDYLLWDRPLSEQPESVRTALEEFGHSVPEEPPLPDDPLVAEIVQEALRRNSGRVDIHALLLTINNDRELYDKAVKVALRTYESVDQLDEQGLTPGDQIYTEAQDYLSNLKTARSITGETVYRVISSKAGTDQAASEALAKAGIPGIKYLAGTSRASGEGDYNYVIFDDKLIEVIRYEQSAEGKARGSYEPGPNIIRLTEQKNLSTFLHEAGHMFLFQLGKYGTRDTSPADVKADLQTTLDWLGAPDFNSLTTEQHEQWARGFETYLREGKAPSLALQDAFARFRAWLLSIYRSLKGLNVELTEDIRGVMDRLLATEEAIAEAKGQLAVSNLGVEELGLTKAEARQYERLSQQAMEQARAEIDAKLLKEQVRHRETWWKEEITKVKADVAPGIRRMPVYRAFLALARNQDPDGNPLPAKIKLNKRAIVDAYGEDALKLLPRPYVYAAEGGIHQDIAARMFGFKSGEELLNALWNMDKINDAIDAEVERVMKERHGDMLNDGTIQREAIEAVQNDKRASFLAVEYQALQRKGGKGAPVEAIKQAAKRIIAESKVDHATQAHRYRQAEIRMAKEAERYAVQGNAVEAMKSKGRQLLNHYLAIEAAKAQAEVEKSTKYFRKFLSRTRKWTGVDMEHIEKIRELLDVYNFNPRMSDLKRSILQHQATFDWLRRKAEDPNALYVIPEEILRADNVQHYRDLTMEEFRALHDTIKSLHANGRALKKALLDEKQRQFDQLVDDVVTSIEAKAEAKPPNNPKHLNPRFWDKGKAAIRTFDSALIKIEQLAIWLDGGERGPFWTAVFKPMADAQAKRFDMLGEYSVKIGKILKSAPQKIRMEWNRDRHTMPDGKAVKGTELMAMALNWGNEDNRSRLMLGEGWTQTDIEAALDKLSKEEWDIVQEIWDTIDTLYPHINEVHKLHTDVALPKVEPLAFQTKFGEYKGGYYPIVYDRNRDPLAEKIAQAKETNLFENNFIKPETQRGFTKGRAKGVKRPLHLSLDVLPKHIDDVTHYIAHFTAIKEVDRFVNNSKIQTAINERFGPEYARLFRPWLQAIAQDTKDSGSPATYVDFALRRLRYGSTMVAMGFKLSTALLQPAGFFNSIGSELGKPVAGGKFTGRKGVYWLGKGFRALAKGGFKQAMEQSGELRHRMQTQDRDLRLAMNEMLNSKLWVIPKVGEIAFKHIAYIDMFTSAATWYAAHEKYMAEVGADPAGAVDYADSVVRMSQSSGAIKDLAVIQRGPESRRIYTMFYTFFSAFYNQMRSAGRNVKGDPVGASAQFLFLVTLPIIYDGALKSLMGKDLYDEDDEETLMDWFLLEHILYPAASVPFARDVASGALGKWGYELSPVAQVGGDIAATLKEVVAQVADEDEELSRTDIKKAVKSFGVVTGLPTAQAYNMLEYMADWMEGNTEPETPIDVFQGLASGTPREDRP